MTIELKWLALSALLTSVMWVPYVLIAHEASVHSSITIAACMIYFFARLAHSIVNGNTCAQDANVRRFVDVHHQRGTGSVALSTYHVSLPD